MKNSFYFLAVLLSVHYLLAQTPSKFDERVKNQIISCRLEDRLKAVGCRLEGTKRISSGSITVNYNNRGEDLSCYLMMNPVVEGAGEGIERLSLDAIRPPDPPESVLAFGETIAGLASTHTITGFIASSNQNQITSIAIHPSEIFESGEEGAEIVSDNEAAWNEAVQESQETSPYGNGVIEDVQAKRIPLAFTQEGATEQREQYLQREKSVLEKALDATQVEAQRMIAEKRKEGEAAFARARQTKNESGWNKAKATAIMISNYWNGVVESIQAGKKTLTLNQEEAIFQKEYWIEKAGVAEVKALETTPCNDDWKAKRDRTDAIIEIIRKKVWPTVSQTMKAFIEHPSEANMFEVREFATAAASATATATASAYISAYVSAHSTAFATSAVYASPYTTAYTSAAAYATAYATSSAYATGTITPAAYAYTFAYATGIGTAPTTAIATAIVFASTIFTSTFTSETLQVADVIDDVANNTKTFADLSRRYLSETGKQNIDWSISAARETADFLRAVTKYKEAGGREESRLQGTNYRRQEGIEDGSQDHSTIVTAREAFSAAWELKSEDAWKRAGIAAREIVRLCQDSQEMNCEDVIQQKDYWVEQAHLANVKCLTVNACANNWDAKLERANAIMKLTCEKFGSPISPSMKAFMANPNETTLRATGKSAIIAMSATEAEEALEGAEIFAKASTDIVALAKTKNWNDSFQEGINLSAFVTSEIADFARTLAAFKRAQESASARK